MLHPPPPRPAEIWGGGGGVVYGPMKLFYIIESLATAN